MVPGTTVSHRVAPGKKLRATGLAHCLCKVCPVKHQSFSGKPVDVRGARILSTVKRQVIIGAVISHDDQHVGGLGRNTQGASHQENKKGG
jgi:hypothetical protein